MKPTSPRMCATLALTLLLALTVLPQIQRRFGSGGVRAEPPQVEVPAPLPPLVIDRQAPLLLEEPANPQDKSFLIINQSCYVCHDNYRTEPLALVHARHSVGCIDCHGPSFAHRDDEDNLTPPEIMFSSDKIDTACARCHETHDAPAQAVIARWQKRCPEKTDPTALVCTDCHGRHRLERRVVRWDKRTGQLLPAAAAQAPSAD